MNNHLTPRTALCAMLLCLSLSAAAQTYSVRYKDTPISRVIEDLRKKTGYEFVCQKQVLESITPVTCTYDGLTIEQLLDRIFYQHAELRYEIVERTIILRQPKDDDEMPSFKHLVVGLVVDPNGEPLPGAVVKQKGNANGATTDIDGNFSLLVEGKNPQLHVSYLGMKDRVVTVAKDRDTPIMVSMDENTNVLAEVMVDGYSNIKRTNATGAYQTITSKELEKRHSGTIVQNLEGTIPGLVTYDTGLGETGEKAMVIRGIGTFNAASHPLVVVDGLPIESSIESVNPYEIATITVLKDAAAAAIYGARAANGVIVVTTKHAESDRLEVEFDTDITLSERQRYDNFGWASAAEMIELERSNFNLVRQSKSALRSMNTALKRNAAALSPVTRMLLQNYNGALSSFTLNEQLDRMAQNDFRSQWQDANEQKQLLQQYNLSLRSRGKRLTSAIAINYRTDNNGMQREYDRQLSLNYRGELQTTSWLNLGFGINLVSSRTKAHISGASEYDGINGFAPYMDATQTLEAGIPLDLACLSDAKMGLMPVGYNVADEANRNFVTGRETNIRSYVNATATLLPGWTATAKFQYEDVYGKNTSIYEAESFYMRQLYNLYTTRSSDGTIVHNVPYGSRRDQSEAEGAYYTFRAQTDYSHTFAQKHEMNASLGFEYRESQLRSSASTMLGYDEQTQTNSNGQVNFRDLTMMSGKASVMGSDYTMVGAPTGEAFSSSDVLNRFYSVYATAGYTYDTRYAATLSFRVDRTNLFGADPQFRGRPLWSAGLSWNAHNEAFLRDVRWVEMLKLRASYGLTGNIAQNFSSYLTASIAVNELTGVKQATLDMPPNDQLRWEKTASFNFGADFVLWHGRLAGTIDAYTRHGSDILTTTDLDPTTGWSQLTINNGRVVNRGFELSLTGAIVKPRRKDDWGVNATFNYSFNHNEVTSINHLPQSGLEALSPFTLHEGRPVHSLYSYDYAGMQAKDGIQYFTWRDASGKVHNSDITSDDFTVADAIYGGSLDPKHVFGFTPEVTWRGITLSAMLSFYGGHVMRAKAERWSGEGSMYGYDGLSEIEAVPSCYLDYWRTGDATQYVANGHAGGENIVGDYHYISANVVSANYMKLRNIVLSYQLPTKWCSRLHLSSARLRLQMNNVATWVRNPLGVDPEANSPSSGDTQKKAPRSYTFSVSLGL